MLSRFTLNDLYGQRANLSTAISNKEAEVAELEGKIRRLERAANSLERYITTIEDSHLKLTNLTIDPSSWQGTEKKKFDDAHQQLQTNSKGLLIQTESAHSQVLEEISRCEAQFTSAEATISHFRNLLADVNAQINARRNKD